MLYRHDLAAPEMITFRWYDLRLAGEESSAAGSEVYWYQTALNGLPERMTDVQGETVWQGIFSTWGETQREQSHAPLAVAQNLRFQGQYLDRETGLHYNLFRYYDPATGRYTQPDPIGLAGGLNTYAYAPNPLTWADPLGLSPCSPMVKPINGRNPINSSYAGKIYPASALPVEIRGKYPHGVPFNHAGFPDFSKYSIKNVRIELGKSRTIDFGRADKAVGYSRSNPRPDGYTWHHHQDSGYMQLVPTDIHSAVKHTGGVATGK